MADVTGETFGMLRALYRVANSECGHTQWMFSCECGAYKVIALQSVRSGATKSCGCLQKTMLRNRRQIDRRKTLELRGHGLTHFQIGQRFGVTRQRAHVIVSQAQREAHL